MASFREVFKDEEKTNWLKACLGLNITKAGLLTFVDNEMKQFKENLLKKVMSSRNLTLTTSCTSCSIKGLCKNRYTMHADPSKRYRPCPNNICDGILDEIIEAHRFPRPSWKNTSAEQWACNHWKMSVCFMPPDGYASVFSIHNTDFNGIINVLLNCKYFATKFSFTIGSGQQDQSCLLTQAREVCKKVRHSINCKVTSSDLHEFFIIFIGILSDSQLLAQDPYAQKAVHELQQLKTDSLNIASEETAQLLKDAQEVLSEGKHVTQKLKLELKTYKVKVDGQKIVIQMKKAYTQDALAFRRRLIKYYKKNMQNVPVASLMQNHDISLMEIYATPAIHRVETKKDGTRNKSEPVLTYKMMFGMGNESKQRIFLQGEPGKGKSTFASKLVLDWCNGCISSRRPSEQETDFFDTDTLQVFKFVFHIALRDSRNQRKVTDMIRKQILEKIYSDKDIDSANILLQTILENETCLVVQDGLDEWSDSKRECWLPILALSFQSIVLITTRPWKMCDDRLKNSQIDCLLEIEGVKDSFVLSRKVLNCLIPNDDLDRKVEQFKNYIHVNGLDELLETPMLITLIVCLWVDKTYVTGSSCQIYTILLDGMLKKANNRTEYFKPQELPFQCFQDTKHFKHNMKRVHSFSKAAFCLLFNDDRENSLVFSEVDILKYMSKEEKMFAMKSGILSERKFSTFSFRPSTCSFINKSVQDFLAAIHIASNVQLVYDVIAPYLYFHQNSCFEISHVFKFLCGLKIDAANKLSRVIDECQQRLYALQESIYMENVCKMQDIIYSGFVEANVNNISVDEIQLQVSHFSFNNQVESDILKIILSKNRYNVLSINCSIKFEDTLDLSSYPNIEDLHVRSQMHIKYIRLGKMSQLKKLVVRCICDGLDLCASHRLKHIDIGEQVKFLPNALSMVRNLARIELRCKCVELDLSDNPNLTYVYLGEQVTLLPKALRSLHALKSLDLRCKCDELDLSACQSLTRIYLGEQITLLPSTLHALYNLEHLELRCAYDGLDMSSCHKLRHIYLVKQVTLIPNSLRDLCNLEHIELRCTYDGLNMSMCHKLRHIYLVKQVTLLPNSMPDLHNLEFIEIGCKYDGLDLSSCHNLKRINLIEQVTLIPNSLRDLHNLERISLRCKYDELDLSSSLKLVHIYLGKQITLIQNSVKDLHNLQFFR